jgi:hypothetical protein
VAVTTQDTIDGAIAVGNLSRKMYLLLKEAEALAAQLAAKGINYAEDPLPAVFELDETSGNMVGTDLTPTQVSQGLQAQAQVCGALVGAWINYLLAPIRIQT